MLCPICSDTALPAGHNRTGCRRWHCLACNRTFTVRVRRCQAGKLAALVADRLWVGLKSRADRL